MIEVCDGIKSNESCFNVVKTEWMFHNTVWISVSCEHL